nr:BlaI/MecI/CopY family transcriptional regulator [Streptomyces himalayensis]
MATAARSGVHRPRVVCRGPQGAAQRTGPGILSRLYEKGIVDRHRQGRGYAYFPVQDAPGLTARRMHSELDRDADRETVLARFVAQLSSDDERLLRELLESGEQ